MSTMVTGGLGAIGSFAVRYLVEQGEQPIVYDSRPDTRLIADLLDRVHLVVGDILDWPLLLSTMQKYAVDRVIHTAALMPPACWSNPPQAVEVNIRGLCFVLEAARAVGVRQVAFASTRGVYDSVSGEYAHPTFKPITEDHPKKPHSLYDATRFFCERLGHQYTENYGIRFIALRFAGTYGPGKWTHGVRAAASQLIDAAILGKPAEIPHGGDQKQEFLYNRDSGRALVLASQAGETAHYQFHIGTGRLHTLYDLAEAIRREIPQASIKIGPGLDPWEFGINRYWLYDLSRARTELGYQPQYDLQDGVRDYIQLVRKLRILG